MMLNTRRLLVAGIMLAAFQGAARAECQLGMLTDGQPDSGDYFGHSMAMAGDQLVIGAYQDDAAGPSSGSAFVYRRDHTAWVEEVRLVGSNTSANDNFGVSVSISGDRLVVGAHMADPGKAYVFHKQGGVWVEEAILEASDGTDNDHFGWSVAIDGDYVVVSAPMKDVDFSKQGVIYIFHRTLSGWVEQARLLASVVSQK